MAGELVADWIMGICAREGGREGGRERGREGAREGEGERAGAGKW